MANKTYKEYFNIDPKYYAAVTEDLIKSGQVKWDAFYPHETFINLLEKTHYMLSGKDARSLWIEGAYGTGKSHAALTIKSMLEASDEEINAYFDDYGLNKQLCQKLITDKNTGNLITIHRIGSASIRSDQDLILAIQDSVTSALREHGIENRGEASLKDSALKWLNEKESNKIYFNSLIQEDKYAWDFGNKSVDQIIEILENSENSQEISTLMRNIIKVAENNGITALRLDIPAMCQWIKSIIQNNGITILFVWDEFTEFFINNPNSLTGFQTLAEISESHPFYFIIVSHEGKAIIHDADMRKKILDRFVSGSTVRIELPDNMAFRLMSQAMKTTDDVVLSKDWEEDKATLNDELNSVRNTIILDAKKRSTMGNKTVLTEEDLMSIVPIHPYAALLLKHMSVAFNSNARSMFDFIISNDITDAKGFKWYIENYGPLDENNLLTVDMLWDFFTGKDQDGLNDDVRVILDSFDLLKANSLTPDQERVFKTILLLEAISLRVKNVDILRPNEQNIDLAFAGTDWSKGKAKNIAEGLCKNNGILFEKPVGNGLKEYTVANSGGDHNKIEQLKKETKENTKTNDLVVSAGLLDSIAMPASIHMRYIKAPITQNNFTFVLNREKSNIPANKFKLMLAFALNDAESESLTSNIVKTIIQPTEGLFFVQSLVPMGDDLFTQYVENMAYSKYYAQNDRTRASGFEKQAKNCLNNWKDKIINGAFMLYTPENKSGIRVANLSSLQEELVRINHNVYLYGLEQYNLIDNMFNKGPLAQGAECGINQTLKGTFSSSNKRTSLDSALIDVWHVDNYWEDSTKKSLPIVKIKNRVDSVVKEGFDSPSGRVSILSIYEALEDAPFGFMPSNVTAFVLGFVLKEYASSDYFWSNGSNNESMSIEKMKQMIANAINQKHSQSSRYKEEYIVAMSASQKSFLQCTSTAFGISQCGSIESARDHIRIKMKNLDFPIWCIKYILNTVSLESPSAQIEIVIDSYCSIANTANGNKESESELANKIGELVQSTPTITNDLSKLFTNEMCQKGMLAYIGVFQDGELQKLASEIGDNGAYLSQVKQKFNADAANWVWNSVTADEKIKDVILEYHIIAESNKSLQKSTNLREVVNAWNMRSNNIRMPYDELRKVAGDLSIFLAQLYYMKQNGQLLEQNKQKFYDALVTQRENFDEFYKDQLPYFKQVNSSFLEDLEDDDMAEFYKKIQAGQFTKSSSEYFNYIEKFVEEFKKTIRKNQLNALWLSKTNTKSPKEWSNKYQTPILCMFDDTERVDAREIFNIMSMPGVTDAQITKAIEYLERANFYDRLSDSKEIERCFMQRVVGDYSVMLDDADYIRKYLSDHSSEHPYRWFDNSSIRNMLISLADRQYKTSGADRAMSIINEMDPEQLRHYLNKLIADNLTVGMEIIKNEQGEF